MKPYTLTIITTILSVIFLAYFAYMAFTTKQLSWMCASMYNLLYLSTKIKIKPLDV